MLKPRTARQRLFIALACYAVLSLVALFTLTGALRWGVLLLFGFLTLKTLSHSGDEPME